MTHTEQLRAALEQLLKECDLAGFDGARDYNWPKAIADARAALAAAPNEQAAVPEAPCHYSSEESFAWQSGWESGYAAAPAAPESKDAARYRWLRDDANWTVICSNGMARFSARIPVPTSMLLNDTANELDTAIDAAIASTQKGESK